MTADSTPDWGFDMANILSVKVPVAFTCKVAGLHLISMESTNEGGTHTIIVQLFTVLLFMIRNALGEDS